MNLCGARPSPHDDRDQEFAFHRSPLFLGAAAPTRESIDVASVHTWRVQGAGSCVSYSTVEMVQDLATAQGKRLPLLSGPWLYARARILGDDPLPGIGLPDSGSNLRLNLKAGRDYGLVTDEVYPDVHGNVHRVPPMIAWEEDPVVKLDVCRRIYGEGNAPMLRDGLIAALMLARDAKCSLPCICMPVDDAYGALAEGDVYSAQGGNPWGGHCQVIGAYDGARDAFAMLSTWEQRVYWVAAEWLAKFGSEPWIVESIFRQVTK